MASAAAEDMSSVARADMSSVATEDVSSAATENMSSVATVCLSTLFQTLCLNTDLMRVWLYESQCLIKPITFHSVFD